MVKQSIYIVMIFALFACTKQESGSTLIVEGVLVAGEPADNVRVSLMRDFSETKVSDATVNLFSDAGDRIALSPRPDAQGVYFDADAAFTPQAGATYRIEVSYEDHFAHATTTVPVQIAATQISATTIPITGDSPGQPVFSVLWQSGAQFSHVLTLDNLEDAPQTIPFDVLAGRFDEQYAVPVPGFGTTLFDTDFEFYGLHTLSIFAIDKDYEAVFFYQPGESGNVITGGPENILGGAGYFTSASRLNIELEIVE